MARLISPQAATPNRAFLGLRRTLPLAWRSPKNEQPAQFTAGNTPAPLAHTRQTAKSQSAFAISDGAVVMTSAAGKFSRTQLPSERHKGRRGGMFTIYTVAEKHVASRKTQGG